MAAARRDDAPGSVGSFGVTTGFLGRAWAESGEVAHQPGHDGLVRHTAKDNPDVGRADCAY